MPSFLFYYFPVLVYICTTTNHKFVYRKKFYLKQWLQTYGGLLPFKIMYIKNDKSSKIMIYIILKGKGSHFLAYRYTCRLFHTKNQIDSENFPELSELDVKEFVKPLLIEEDVRLLREAIFSCNFIMTPFQVLNTISHIVCMRMLSAWEWCHRTDLPL